MKRKRARTYRAPNFSSATIPTAIAAKQAAIWALRMANSDIRNSLISQHPHCFLEITAPYLRWSQTAFRKYLSFHDSQDDIQSTELEELSPQAAWKILIDENDDRHQQAFIDCWQYKRATLMQVFRVSLRALEKEAIAACDPVMENVQMLQHLLGFSDCEAKLLHILAVASQNTAVRAILEHTNVKNATDAVSIFAFLIGEDELLVRAALKENGPLKELRFVTMDAFPGSLHEAIHLQEWCAPCFSEPHASVADMARNFLEPAHESSLGERDFPHLKEDFDALTRYLAGVLKAKSKGVNILIYGRPGTGKTEFSKVLADSIGARLYEVANRFENGEPIASEHRLSYLKLSERVLANRQRALILFDEIEDVFPVSRELGYLPKGHVASSKAWMNRTLETNQVPVIWVSNRVDQIDPAYLRRFSYHLEVRTPPARVRQRIAERYLAGTPVSEKFVQQIASNSELTPALMESAAKVVNLSGVSDTDGAERLASRVIRQCQAVMGQVGSGAQRPLMTGYSLDYLNLDSRYSISQIVSALRQRPSGSLCFYGLPGTGKTALAEHIAETLGRPLLAKRASDLLSKWLGDSERNIASMFREAASEQAVLLLDEADSFLRNREQAERSWEVSLVNELLQQMEHFDGVFICATNLFEQIDPAALRRFAFKIAFKALEPAQRLGLFVQEALAGDEHRMTSKLRERLNRLNSLVPGDFAVVKRQAALLGLLLEPEDFLRELEEECQVKPSSQSRAIGFV